MHESTERVLKSTHGHGHAVVLLVGSAAAEEADDEDDDADDDEHDRRAAHRAPEEVEVFGESRLHDGARDDQRQTA